MRAFTLAEVLITLGIIGIVAAMTMPTLIQKNEERVTVTKVKKFYSVMNQALLMSIKDNGYVNEWSFEGGHGSPEFAEKYIVPYLKTSKICAQNPGCIAPEGYSYMNGQYYANYDSVFHYKMILADGSYLWLRNTGTAGCQGHEGATDENVCGMIWIDVNGKKTPNTFGKDVFTFYIMKNRITPNPMDDCPSGKNGSSGWGCSSYILKNDNMNYLKN